MAGETYRLKGTKTLKFDKKSIVPDTSPYAHNFFIDDNAWTAWKDVLERQDSSNQFDPNSSY